MSSKGRKKTEIKAERAARKALAKASVKTARVLAAEARVRAALDAGMARMVAKTTKGKPASPKMPVGRPPRLGPDGQPATCNVKDCGAPYRSKGYCSAHYQFARKTRTAADSSTHWPMPLTKGNWNPARHDLPVAKATARWPQ
jgi:hypothetical protein